MNVKYLTIFYEFNWNLIGFLKKKARHQVDPDSVPYNNRIKPLID